MKVSASGLLAVWSFASLWSSGNAVPLAPQSVGAAYFLTNEPTGNFIVSASIGSDGKLTLAQAVKAQGAGAHGGPAPTNGSDPLFSQGAVKVSAAGNILATVNSGSNTISVFSIGQDPTKLQPIGFPVSSGGEFPVSLAINKKGNMVCTLNGGAVAGVACFAVDKQKQTVAPIANTVRSLALNQTTPANGPPGTASHIIFSEDNSQLIAAVKGVPPTPGFLAVWNIAADNSLSADFKSVAPAKGGALPFGMSVIAGQNAIISADPAVGLTIFDMSAKATKSSALSIPGQAAVCWTAFSSKTGNFYLTDAGTGVVSEVNVDKATLKPKLVKQYPQGDGAATLDADVASVGNKDFLYVLAAGKSSVNVLSLDAPGRTTAVQSLDLAGPAKRAKLPISAANLQGMTTFIKKN